jgi:hypothetical protein
MQFFLSLIFWQCNRSKSTVIVWFRKQCHRRLFKFCENVAICRYFSLVVKTITQNNICPRHLSVLDMHLLMSVYKKKNVHNKMSAIQRYRAILLTIVVSFPSSMIPAKFTSSFHFVYILGHVTKLFEVQRVIG